MWGVQMWGREDWLLLSLVIIHATWLWESEVSPGRIHNISGSYLWFLSQVPLQAQLHWAVLGSCKADLQDLPKDKRHDRNGRKCKELTWRCASCPNSMVRFFLHMSVAIINFSYQFCESHCLIYQRVWPKLEWSRSGLGKPEISWPPNIASRNGYKAENWAQEEVWYTAQ